jgi:arylsulfatase A-like enzyme
MIAQQEPMTETEASMSDLLYASRWESLLSVDDLVEAVWNKIVEKQQENNTYIMLTSDHGTKSHYIPLLCRCAFPSMAEEGR